MGKLKFQTKVLFLGELTQEFVDEDILVFFGKDVPEELHDHAIVHETMKPLEGTMEVGDAIRIGDQEYPVLAIGTVVNDNLRSMGHLVIKFNGRTEPEMEGDVCVPVRDLPGNRTWNDRGNTRQRIAAG